MMNLHQQIEFDIKYRKKQENNMYYDIVLYILYFITGGLYMIPITSSVGIRIIFIYIMFTALIIEIYSNPLLVVREKGRNINIFEKYKFTPIDIKIFAKAKQIIIFKYGIKLTIFFELIHIIGILIYKISFLSIETIFPIVIVSLFTLIKLLQIECYVNKYA